MLSVTSSGFAEAGNLLDGFSARRLAAVKATAATRTAAIARDAIVAEMRRVLDRPTPYTLGAIGIRRATAERPDAQVYVRDWAPNGGTPAERYLNPNVTGGQRRDKRLEVALRAAGALPAGWYVVPAAGANLDAYGNVSRGQIIQVLSQLRITLLAGASRNMSWDLAKMRRAQRRAGGRFFVIKPGQAGAAQKAPGVYQREFFGRTVTPVFLFVNRATYRPRWDFFGVGRKVVEREIGPQWARAVAESAARLRARGASVEASA